MRSDPTLPDKTTRKRSRFNSRLIPRLTKLPPVSELNISTRQSREGDIVRKRPVCDNLSPSRFAASRSTFLAFLNIRVFQPRTTMSASFRLPHLPKNFVEGSSQIVVPAKWRIWVISRGACNCEMRAALARGELTRTPKE